MSQANSLKGYKLVFTKSAEKDLKKISASIAYAIEKKLVKLIEDTTNLDIKKLIGYKFPTYRLRVGDYRAIYEVHEQKIIVLVIHVKHRKDAYIA